MSPTGERRYARRSLPDNGLSCWYGADALSSAHGPGARSVKCDARRVCPESC